MRFAWKLKDTTWWLRHRTINRYHTVRCDGLNPGYYEAETRMLHSMFGLLREFVEKECAWMTLISRDRPTGWLKRKLWHGTPAAGLEYLDWEIGLRHAEHQVHDPELVGKPTPQAISAQEVKYLYLWWVNIRPARLEPGDASGAYEAYDKLSGSGYQWWTPCEDNPHLRRFAKDTDDPLYKDWSAKAMLSGELEERYHDEDEAMMKRLVAVRRSMWT